MDEFYLPRLKLDRNLIQRVSFKSQQETEGEKRAAVLQKTRPAPSGKTRLSLFCMKEKAIKTKREPLFFSTSVTLSFSDDGAEVEYKVEESINGDCCLHICWRSLPHPV